MSDLLSQLLLNELSQKIENKTKEENMNLDVNKLNNKIVSILEEIVCVLFNENYSDFEIVEEIVTIFEKNNIYVGGQHDF